MMNAHAMKMKWVILILLPVLILLSGCSSAPAPAPEPESTETARSTGPLNLPANPAMPGIARTIVRYGRLAKQHMTHQAYREQSSASAAVSPELFYDRYILEVNEKNHFFTITFSTAEKAIRKDPAVEEVMAGFPVTAIDVRLVKPGGSVYIMSDADADGVLDYARRASDPPSSDVSLDLLSAMQRQYNRVLNIIKRHSR